MIPIDTNIVYLVKVKFEDEEDMSFLGTATYPRHSFSTKDEPIVEWLSNTTFPVRREKLEFLSMEEDGTYVYVNYLTRDKYDKTDIYLFIPVTHESLATVKEDITNYDDLISKTKGNDSLLQEFLRNQRDTEEWDYEGK